MKDQADEINTKILEYYITVHVEDKKNLITIQHQIIQIFILYSTLECSANSVSIYCCITNNLFFNNFKRGLKIIKKKKNL